MTESPDLEEELVALAPTLRAFARSLTGNIDHADDLVQETILKAWSNLGSFQRGTNMRAWAFTIMRNTFYSVKRKRKREVEDVDGQYAAQLVDLPAQGGAMAMRDFERAFKTLPPEQREALTLVGASGFSYEEAAEVCGCAVGTVKSRVNRARAQLVEILGDPEDAGGSARGRTAP